MNTHKTTRITDRKNVYFVGDRSATYTREQFNKMRKALYKRFPHYHVYDYSENFPYFAISKPRNDIFTMKDTYEMRWFFEGVISMLERKA